MQSFGAQHSTVAHMLDSTLKSVLLFILESGRMTQAYEKLCRFSRAADEGSRHIEEAQGSSHRRLETVDLVYCQLVSRYETHAVV